MKKLLLFLLWLTLGLQAQERQTDPTWLHRYVPDLSETKAGLTSPTCHYRAIFGEGDKENRSLQAVTRFGEVSLDPKGNCQAVSYDRQEEIYFVVEGAGMLHYQDQVQALRKHDFTYLPPGAKHSIANQSDKPLRVLVMGFKIPSSISIGAPMPHPKVANLEDSREETVSGHQGHGGQGRARTMAPSLPNVPLALARLAGAVHPIGGTVWSLGMAPATSES